MAAHTAAIVTNNRTDRRFKIREQDGDWECTCGKFPCLHMRKAWKAYRNSAQPVDMTVVVIREGAF